LHKLTFYPLGNADCCLIDLDNGQKILFDYADVGDSDDDDDLRIDLPEKLREDLEEAGKDSYDVVAITHADEDHIKGFSEFFYLEHAQKYQDDERIKIDTLWVPAAIILETSPSTDDHRILRQEARHRLKEGKGIRVFSKPELLEDWLKEQGLKLEDRKALITNAGQIIPGYDKSSEGVEFFVHAPFSESIDDEEIERNKASLVVQVTFKIENQDTQLIMGADINHEVWTDIVRITQHYNRDDRLKWDIFKISHHCSYTALSDTKGTTKTVPVEKVKWLFEQGHDKAILVSTSDPIPVETTKPPPHRQAANYYKEMAKDIDGEFKVTMEHPKKSAPEPLVITIDSSKATIEEQSVSAATLIASQRSPRMG
jgi:beta-lactamase superfamily II metal-dependent hydrolase